MTATSARYAFPAGTDGDVTIGYLPNRPEPDAGLFVRLTRGCDAPDITREICFDLEWWRSTGEVTGGSALGWTIEAR